VDGIAEFFKGTGAIGVMNIGAAIVLLALARLLLPPKERERTRIAAIYLILAVTFGIVAWFSPAKSKLETTIEFFFFFFVFASCGRSLVLLAVDVVFGKRTQRTVPRIFRDLTQAVVYLIVVMLTLKVGGVEPSSLLTTSALLTAVVGLSLQDTLGNLVSGLALQMQQPFQIGDWIQFESDPRQIGQVTEVNWRATTVMTSDLVEVIVPNSMLAKSPIRNYSRPSKVSRRSVAVSGAYAAPPHRVQEAIEKALVGTPGVLREPSPWVQTKVFGDSGIEYTVWFFTDDYAARERTDGFVRDRVWYAMQRAKLEIPFPIRTVHMHQVSEESKDRDREQELQRRDSVLRCVDFLDVLPVETHRTLAARSDVRLFAPGETIIQQGDTGGDLFIIDRGEVYVEHRRDGRVMPIAKLGPGKFFGEMGFMIGEVRTATVRAVTDCALLVVGHDAFHDTIRPVPGVVEKMSDLLAVRQAELEAVASEKRKSIEPMEDRSKRLISQIKSFFKL
jgi:small-conductance mechanosensitive channel/CRP-like cAMP-binding protein